MITFLLGLAVLIAGGFVYGRICDRVMKPTDRKTPAVEKYDGVDFVPMKKWKNSLLTLAFTIALIVFGKRGAEPTGPRRR